MNDIELLLDYLSPNIKDLNEAKDNANILKVELNEFSKFFSYVGNNINLLNKYENQDFVKSYLLDFGSNASEFEANAYLADNDNMSIRILPQFRDALNYLNNYLIFLNHKKQEIEQLYDKALIDYKNKYLSNKYYYLFSTSDKFVGDIIEFINFMNDLNIDPAIKINVITFVIKNNIDNYKHRSSTRKELLNNQDIVVVHQIINDNQELINPNNLNFMVKIARHVNLAYPLRDVINSDTLIMYSISDIIKAKKIWFVKNIVDNYRGCCFKKVSFYTDEYLQLIALENRLSNVINQKEIIRIIKEES